MVGEICSVVGKPKAPGGCFDFERVRQTNIAELEMMPVGFAISRDVYHSSIVRNSRKSIHQTLARLQKIFKSNCSGCWAFVKENRNRSVRAVTTGITIGDAGIDSVVVRLSPLGFAR